jgi:hypothetical protein
MLQSAIPAVSGLCNHGGCIGVEPRAGRRSAYVNLRYVGRARIGAMDGVVPVLEEDEYLCGKRGP